MSDVSSYFNDSVARAYEQNLVPRMFTPWAKRLLDEIDLRAGQSVLDVACGTGAATRLIVERIGSNGRVTGCDLNDGMLSVARAVSTGVATTEYVQAPADRLPFGDAIFDAAICQQGLQFFPDQPSALREMRRVLRPGGTLGIAVWAALETQPLWVAMTKRLEEFQLDDIAAMSRIPFSYGSAQRLEEEISAAGFTDVRVQTLRLPLVANDAEIALAMAKSTPWHGALVQSGSPALGAYETALMSDYQELVKDGQVRSEMSSHIAVAHA